LENISLFDSEKIDFYHKLLSEIYIASVEDYEMIQKLVCNKKFDCINAKDI
jgi:hypothetical protein